MVRVKKVTDGYVVSRQGEVIGRFKTVRGAVIFALNDVRCAGSVELCESVKKDLTELLYQ